MAVWLVRAGKHGEHEQRFIEDKRVYLTWEEIPESLASISSHDEIRELLRSHFPDKPRGAIASHTGQFASFLLRMAQGDLVVVPRKGRGQYAVGEIIGDYTYAPKQPEPYWHFRPVKWVNLEVPKASFDLDLQFSLNSIATICGVNRTLAHERIFSVATGSAPVGPRGAAVTDGSDTAEQQTDLEDVANTQIAQHIIQKFKGHRLAELVAAVLHAQGYTTFVSPPGADGGIDILAAPGPLGFGHPRLCVQVKSSDAPVDTPTVSQLIGAMQNAQAEQGLFVAWGGFKDSVVRNIPSQFFRVRLWDQDDLIDQLLENYDKLSADLKAELPLKRIWSLALAGQDSDD